ncbi:MAG: hypothetical protein AB1644_09170 [Candidatus Zixiibacteriota bacterium]
MSGGDSITTGAPALLLDAYEERHTVYAQGCDFHESDVRARGGNYDRWASTLEANPTNATYQSIRAEIQTATATPLPDAADEPYIRWLIRQFRDAMGTLFHDYLREHLRDVPGNESNEYIVNSETSSEYTNDVQRVHFTIEIVYSKQALKQALEREDTQVIYGGHSRYGRGSAFHQYSGAVPVTGEHWECGTGPDNGIYRLAYPFVPVSFHDIETHQYECYPVAVEDGLPATRDRHPDARRSLSRVSLPGDAVGYVAPYYESPSQQYYGCRILGEQHVLMYANWTESLGAPYDIGATDMRCRCFCHFGCSSRLHFREIVRGAGYKNWGRDNPPTTRFAYFTTAEAYPMETTAYWMHRWLTYNRQNNHQSWWNSLESAKRTANRDLAGRRYGYRVY